jgi:hypothetical protein
MWLTYDTLLRYDANTAQQSVCLCHLRIYEDKTSPPVVVVGELADTGGTISVTNSIEQVAGAVARDYFCGKDDFRLILYKPALRDTLDLPFQEVRFRGAGDATFKRPEWHPVDIAQLLQGAPIKMWRPKDYTVYAVAGDDGERIREDVAFHNAVRTHVRR